MGSDPTRSTLLVRRIFEDMWNQGKPELAHEIFARPEGVKQYVATFLAAFPDLHHTIEEAIAEGDTVAVRWTARGTHTGQWHSLPATGASVSFAGVTFAHVVDGKIADHSTIWDTVGLLEQIGAVPAIRKADGSRL